MKYSDTQRIEKIYETTEKLLNDVKTHKDIKNLIDQ